MATPVTPQAKTAGVVSTPAALTRAKLHNLLDRPTPPGHASAMRHTIRLDPHEPGQNSDLRLWVLWDPPLPDGERHTGLALVWRFAPERRTARLGVVAIDARWTELTWNDDEDSLMLRGDAKERHEPLAWICLDLRDGRLTPEPESPGSALLAGRLAPRLTGPLLDIFGALDYQVRTGGPPMAEALPNRVTDPGCFVAWSEAALEARPDEYILADGTRIAVELLFCPNPHCSCELFNVEFFVRQRHGGLPVYIGTGEASYKDSNATPEFHATLPGRSDQVRAAWDAFRSRYNDLRYFNSLAKQLKEWAAPFVRALVRGKRAAPRVSRNAPCRCGSGQKYKKCCWAADNAQGVVPLSPLIDPRTVSRPPAARPLPQLVEPDPGGGRSRGAAETS